MDFVDGVALYAAVVSTGVALIQLASWLRSRVDAQLTVLPRRYDFKPDCFGHIEVDVQATNSPTTIRAIYLAGYKSFWHWVLGANPGEIVSNEWSKVLPKTIEPGHGWEGLFSINDAERELAARYSHIRLTVRHTGFGKITSKAVTKALKS